MKIPRKPKPTVRKTLSFRSLEGGRIEATLKLRSSRKVLASHKVGMPTWAKDNAAIVFGPTNRLSYSNVEHGQLLYGTLARVLQQLARRSGRIVSQVEPIRVVDGRILKRHKFSPSGPSKTVFIREYTPKEAAATSQSLSKPERTLLEAFEKHLDIRSK